MAVVKPVYYPQAGAKCHQSTDCDHKHEERPYCGVDHAPRILGSICNKTFNPLILVKTTK